MLSSVTKNNHHSHKYFLVAFCLINILSFTFLLCVVSLLVKSTISFWQFPLACVFSLIPTWFALKFFCGQKSKLFSVKIIVAVFCLVGGSIILSGSFYDYSFDGQWYHQETVIQLKAGYNPFYKVLVPAGVDILKTTQDCDEIIKPGSNVIKPATKLVNLKFLNINNACKGTEIIASAIYCLTNHIETAKAVNLIILIATLLLCVSLLYQFDRISNVKKWLLAIILTFNPIAINELFSFCVDGVAGCLLLCLLMSFCLLLLQQNRYYLFMLGCIIILAINVKVSILAYTVILCFGFLFVLIVYKKNILFKWVLITGTIAAVLGIFVFGFNPYVTNTVQNKNIFYGIDDTRVEIVRLTPANFKDLNRFEKLYFMLMGHQDWDEAGKLPINQTVKMPLTINKKDIAAASQLESFAGFGPFFSGAILISIILFAITAIFFNKTNAFKFGGLAISFILLTIIIMPESWWARFVPQLWLVPVIILCISEFVTFRGNWLLKWGIYSTLLLSMAWASLTIMSFLFVTARIDYQLKQLQALHQPVNIEYCNFRVFTSNRLRFDEADIPVSSNVVVKYQYRIPYSTSFVQTSKPLPQLKKSFILKLSEHILGRKTPDN